MRRVKRSSCIDIYSAPTLDYRHGRPALGGPLYYAQLALRSAGHKTTARWALRCPEGGSPYTVFEVEDVEGFKRLKLRSHSRWACPIPRCSAALFSPVYHDFPLHILNVSRLYKHCIIDIQGIVRVADVEGSIEHRVETANIDVGSCIVKIGADDVESIASLEQLMNILKPRKAIFTANGYGFIVYDAETDAAIQVRVRMVKAEAVGAGDMFNALILSYIMQGLAVEEAALKAAEEVAEIIARRAGVTLEGEYIRSVKRLPCASSYLNEVIKLTINS